MVELATGIVTPVGGGGVALRGRAPHREEKREQGEEEGKAAHGGQGEQRGRGAEEQRRVRD